MASIVYWVGVVLAVICVYELLFKKHADSLILRVIVALLVLATSWIGLVVYYLLLRNRIK